MFHSRLTPKCRPEVLVFDLVARSDFTVGPGELFRRFVNAIMVTLREVKKRIKTIVSTKRITSAMELVAASKLRLAQQKIEQMESEQSFSYDD